MPSPTPPLEPERRRKSRLEHGNLKVHVRPTGFLGLFRQPQVVDWLNFHGEGLAFFSTRRYPQGALILLDLHIADRMTIDLRNVPGRIRNVRAWEHGFRHGVLFDLESAGGDAARVRADLACLEELLVDLHSRLST